jgi:preprotein translocase subunit SecA
MTQLATNELFHIFDARRVKAAELRGLDSYVNGFVGYFKNRRPMLAKLREQAKRVAAIEPELKTLSSARFKEEVDQLRDLARLDRLKGPAYDRAFAVAREAVVRGLGLRPYDVQIMGAMAMCTGAVSEMATGEGKTITAAMAGAVWSWYGRPVHVITVNDYLVKRDAEEMTPIYKMMGSSVGYVIHETSPQERVQQYRRGAVYCTSKELVADFLRDQLALGNLRTAGQTATGMLMTGPRANPLMIPGLFRVIVDEADSLLIDEAVTPLIISNSPNEEPNADIYRAAWDLAQHLVPGRDFVIDKTVRTVDLKPAGQDRLDEIAGDSGFFRGKRRREEMVTQALVAKYCFIRDEQYLIDDEGKVQIIDEFTGRIMADRSWRHGLHQAIEVKEGVPCTADKENLARQSFQRFFRQYPIMGGMTGTAWEAAAELWQIYQRPVIRIPTNKPCIRKQLPVRMFDTMDQKYDAVVARVVELHDKGVPVLIGTRSVLASEEVSKRLQQAGRQHRVLNATQTKVEAEIVASAGQKGQITVATNMAGRGTDIKLSRGVAELGGLHVISTEPHGSYRVDRQLFGRAARQGDPGCAQMFTCAEDDLFLRHAAKLRHAWRTIGAARLIRIAQAHAERLARFNRKQVLKADEWNDQSLPF